jgi:hypothetical protein
LEEFSAKVLRAKGAEGRKAGTMKGKTLEMNRNAEEGRPLRLDAEGD